MDEKELQSLYNAVNSKFDIGDFGTFKTKMTTTEDRKKFYDVVGSKGFDLGDYGAYEKRIGSTLTPPTDLSFGKADVANRITNSRAPLPQPVATQQPKEDLSASMIRNYEASQDAYVKADKKALDLDMDNKSMLSIEPLLDNINNALLPEAKYQKEGAKKIAEKDRDVQKQWANKGLQAVHPFVDGITKEVLNSGNILTKKSAEEIEIPDYLAIDELAKQVAKQNGVKEDGYFKTLIYNKISSAAISKIIEPSVNEEFNAIFKKENGKTPDEAMGEDFKTKFTEGSKISANTELQVAGITNQIKTETTAKVQAVYTGYQQKIDTLNKEIGAAKETVNAGFGNLIVDGKFTGTQQQYAEYTKAMEAVKIIAAPIASMQQKLTKEFLNEQNIINTKANARYRRQVEEIYSGYDLKMNEAAAKYQAAYQQNPELKAKVESAYKKAYSNVIKKREGLKEAIGGFDTPTTGFVKSFVSALGGTIKGLSNTFGIDKGQAIGDFIANEFQPASSEITGVADFINPAKLTRSIGQLAGGMAIGMGAAATTAIATRGMGGSATLAMLTGATASFGAETADLAGRMYEEKFAETGDAAIATRSANELVKSQIMLMPAYGLESLPFMGSAVKLGKNMVTRAVVGGALEVATETVQEYGQNLFEEAIKTDGTFKTALAYHTADKLKRTALNIAPVFLLGAAGQVKGEFDEKIEKVNQEKAVKQQILTAATAFAQKVKFADLAPTQREQFLFDMVQRNGGNFTSAYLLSSFTSGNMDKATFNEMGTSLVTALDISNKSKELGLSESHQKIFAAFTYNYDKAKANFEKETDPLLKSAAEKIMKDYEAQVTNFASKKEADYAVVTYANNEQYLFTHNEMEQALSKEDFANELKEGKLKVAVFGKNENLQNAVNLLTAPPVVMQTPADQAAPVSATGSDTKVVELPTEYSEVNNTNLLNSKYYVPKSIQEKAYQNDAANQGQQSFEKIIERGGYSEREMDKLLPDWKNKVAELNKPKTETPQSLPDQVAKLRAEEQAEYDAKIPNAEQKVEEVKPVENTAISDLLSDVNTGKINADDAAIKLDESGIEVSNEVYDQFREAENRFRKGEQGLQVGDTVTVKGKNGVEDFEGNFRGITNDGKYVVVNKNGYQSAYEKADILEQSLPTQAETKIAELRAAEQAEYDAIGANGDITTPIIEAKKKEIYDKYDKLITPLLKEIENAPTPSQADKPIQPITAEPKEQGAKENVQPSADGVGQGGAEGAVTVYRSGKVNSDVAYFAETEAYANTFSEEKGKKTEAKVVAHQIKPGKVLDITGNYQNKTTATKLQKIFEANGVKFTEAEQRQIKSLAKKYEGDPTFSQIVNISAFIDAAKRAGFDTIKQRETTVVDKNGTFSKKDKDLNNSYAVLNPEAILDVESRVEAQGEAVRKKYLADKQKEVGYSDFSNNNKQYQREAAQAKSFFIAENKPKKEVSDNQLKRLDAIKLYKEIGAYEPATDARGMALQYIASGGKISEESINEMAGSVKRASLNTWWKKEKKTSEVKERDYASKDGKTIQEVVDSIIDNLPENSKVTESEMIEAMNDAVLSYNTRLSAAAAFKEMNEIKDVEVYLTDEEAQVLNDEMMAAVNEIVDNSPVELQNEVLSLIDKYNNNGVIDWVKMEEDSSGFNPDFLNLSEEAALFINDAINVKLYGESKLQNINDESAGTPTDGRQGGDSSNKGKANEKEDGKDGEGEAVKVKTNEQKATEELLTAANEELRIAKEALLDKRNALDKAIAEDAADLFGERKSDAKKALFNERIDADARENAITPFKERVEKAKLEVDRLNKKLKDLEGKATAQGDMFEAAKPKSFDDKADAIANKAKAWAKKNLAAKDMDGVKRSGVGIDELIDAANFVIKKSYKAGVEISAVINDAIKYIKDRWDDNWGAFDEKGLRDIYENDLTEMARFDKWKDYAISQFRKESGKLDFPTFRKRFLEKFNASTDTSSVDINEIYAEAQKDYKAKPIDTKGVIDATTGVKKPDDKIVMSERAALKNQIRFEAKAAKNVEWVRKNFAATIKAHLDLSIKNGFISVKQAAQLVKRAVDVGINSEKLNDFMDYAEKVIDDANYQDKLDTGKGIRAKVSTAIKNKSYDRSANNVEAIRSFLRIDPAKVESIDEYNEIADKILTNAKGISVKVKEGAAVISDESYRIDNDAIDTFVEKQAKYGEQMAKEKLVQTYQDLVDAGAIDPATMSLKDMKEIIAAINNENVVEGEAYLLEQAKKKEKLDGLKKMLDYQKLGLEEWYKNQAYMPRTAEQLEIVRNLLDINTENLSIKQLAKLNDVINNIVVNDNFTDAGNMSILSKVQKDNVNILAQEKKLGIQLGSIENIAIRSFASINLMTEFITKHSKLAAEVQRLTGISGIFNGHADAKRTQDKAVRECIQLKKKLGKDVDTAESRYTRGVYAAVIRNFGGTKAEIDAEFERIAGEDGLIKQTADKLSKSTIEEEQKQGELLLKIYDKILKGSANAAEVKAKISAGNAQLVGFWKAKWAERVGSFSENAEHYDNKILPIENNYTATKMKGVNKKAGVTANNERDIFDQIYFSKKVDNKMAGTKNSRTKSKFLPTDTVLDLDFDSVQSEKFYETNYDVATKKAIAQVRMFFESPEAIEILGGVGNAGIMLESIKKTVLLQKGKVAPVEAWERAMTKTLNIAQAKGVRLALGGGLQFLKQYPTVAISTLVNLGGDASLYFKALTSSNNLPIFDKFNIGLRGETKAGFNKEIDLGYIDRTDFSNSISRTAGVINEIGVKLSDASLAALTLSDVAVARTSWKAYYMKSLKEQGLDNNIDWKNEHKTPNEEAAAYAEQMVSRSQNANDGSSMGDFYRDSRGAKGVVKNVLAPFSSFSTNQRMRMTNDMQKLTNGGNKKEAVKSLAATAAEVVAFNYLKVALIGSIITTPLARTIAGMFGLWDDDDEKDATLKDGDVNINKGGEGVNVSPTTKKVVANAVSDYFFSGMGAVTQSIANEGMNKAYSFLYDEKYTNKDGVQTNKDPKLFYKYDPTEKGNTDYGWFGMYGIAGAKVESAYKTGKAAITGETDVVLKGGPFEKSKDGTDKMGRVKMTDRERHANALAFIIDGLGIAGVGDADILAINQKFKSILDKKMAERYGKKEKEYFLTKPKKKRSNF